MKDINVNRKYVNVDNVLRLPVKREIYRKSNTYEDGWKDLQKLIEKLPSFTVDELKRHGHWKTCTKQAHTAPPFTYTIIECSLCCNPVQKYWNFCPWCGADMREKAEEN